MKASNLLDGILINPYRQELERIQIARDLDVSYAVLSCE